MSYVWRSDANYILEDRIADYVTELNAKREAYETFSIQAKMMEDELRELGGG